jgi:hypothetical protein
LPIQVLLQKRKQKQLCTQALPDLSDSCFLEMYCVLHSCLKIYHEHFTNVKNNYLNIYTIMVYRKRSRLEHQSEHAVPLDASRSNGNFGVTSLSKEPLPKLLRVGMPYIRDARRLEYTHAIADPDNQGYVISALL